MKKYFFLALIIAACSPDDVSGPDNNNGEEEVSSGDCAITLDSKITIDTRIENTSSACDCLVKKGGTTIENGELTIDPGVTLRFEQDADLFFTNQGRLYAVGTASQRIRFEGAEKVKGFAYGIYFNNDGIPSTIEYADFKYLGKKHPHISWDAAIDGSRGAGELSFKHSTVSGSDFNGASFGEMNLDEFENNAFFDNDQFGLRIHPQHLSKLDEASDYLGQNAPNGRPYINVYGTASIVSGPVRGDHTWRNVGGPYFVSYPITLESGDITILEGTTFIFDKGEGLKVYEGASLKVEGTADSPVIFSKEEGTTSPWDGLFFFDSDQARNYINHAHISYAGANTSNGYRGAISMWGSYLYMSNTTIENSIDMAVCLGNFASDSEVEQGEGNNLENNPGGSISDLCK